MRYKLLFIYLNRNISVKKKTRRFKFKKIRIVKEIFFIHETTLSEFLQNFSVDIFFQVPNEEWTRKCFYFKIFRIYSKVFTR